MGKFERTRGSLRANPWNAGAQLGTPGRSHVSGRSRPAGGPPTSPPLAVPFYDRGHRREAIPWRGSMTARSAEREGQVGRTLDRAGRRGPLTPEEREVVAARLRELKRVVIPPLQRVMQSPDPDPTDRESYHRATNELDWLLEIVEHSARLDRTPGPATGGSRAASRRRRKEDREKAGSGGISENQDPGARLMPTTGREGRTVTR
jgi:hypothetical protein